MKFVRFLVIGFLLTIFWGTTHAVQFTDVPPSYKHYNAILTLADRAIIQGYPDRSFRPEQTINRAEALKLLVGSQFPPTTIERALDERRAKNHWYVNWQDVPVADWFAPYIEIASRNNIVRGYQDNTFKPTIPVNFAEGLKMILMTYKVDLSALPFQPSSLLYVKSNDWYAPYFGYAQDKNLLNTNKFYHPAQPMTRGEFAEIIYRLEVLKMGGFDSFASSFMSSDEYTVTISRLNIINQRVAFADLRDGKGALEILRKFPFGHYLARPGERKKMVLYGHSSGYAWDQSPYKVVLRQIDQLRPGDKIFINYQEKGYVYRIDRTRIVREADDQEIITNAQENELVIYTCWPPDSTQYRYLVYAKPV